MSPETSTYGFAAGAVPQLWPRTAGNIATGLDGDLTETKRLGTKRILVVEDDGAVQEALATILREEGGYVVSTASQGEEALEVLEGDALPDLILLDLRMPVMDGWQFRTAQRRNSRLATIPVVAVSADHSSQAAAISADAFLKKPFDATELLATIERVLADDEQRRGSSRWRRLDRFAALGRVTAGVGHEINNPLAFVLLNVTHANYRLRRLAGPPEVLEIADLLSDSLIGLERIRGVVRNLQHLSRKPDGQWEPVNLEKVLDESIGIAWHQIQHRARVTKRYGKIPLVRGSAGALGQVFLNLLINAAQATPEGNAAGNEIAVVTSFDGAHVVVEIADTGRGIAADLLPRIFEPFFTTKSPEEGTGLGLAICQQIVRDHGGRLGIESELGQGTVCSVSLRPVPADADTAADAEKPAAKPSPSLMAMRPPRRGRVLVIDDEAMIGRVITTILSKNHHVVAVQNAEAAFELLTAGESFDLVLCDLLMPNISGPAVHDIFVTRWPHLLPRLVFMTGGACSPESVAFLARTLCPVLYKPFVPSDLDEIINAHLDRAALSGRPS